MAVSINKATDKWMKTGNKLGNQALSENEKAGKQYIKSLNPYYENTAKQLVSNASESKNRLQQDYQSSYDLNAVRQIVAQRQLKEQMANAGLSDSGLNRSQQTALATGRMNADSAIDRNKFAANANIESQLQNNLAENENNKIMQNAQAMWQATQSGLNAKNAIKQSALGYGYDDYRTDKTNQWQADENKANRTWQSNENKKDRQATSAENEKSRNYEYTKTMLSGSGTDTSDTGISSETRESLKELVAGTKRTDNLSQNAAVANFILSLPASQRQAASDWIADYVRNGLAEEEDTTVTGGANKNAKKTSSNKKTSNTSSSNTATKRS